MEIMNNLIWFIDVILLAIPKLIIYLTLYFGVLCLAIILFLIVFITPFLLIVLPIQLQLKQWKFKRNFKDLYNENLNRNDKIFSDIKRISFLISIGTILFLVLPIFQFSNNSYEKSNKILTSEVNINQGFGIPNDYEWNPTYLVIQYEKSDDLDGFPDSINIYRKNEFSFNGFGLCMLSTIGSFYFVITGRNIVFNQYRRDLGFIPFNFIDYNLISYFLVLIISFLIFIFCYRGLLEVNRIIFCKELDKDNKTDVEIVKKDIIDIARQLCKYFLGLFFIFILVLLLFGQYTYLHFGFYLLIFIITMFDLGLWKLKYFEIETLFLENRPPIERPIIEYFQKYF